MLPKNEKTFEINIEGDTTRERFIGTFTCICVPWAGLRNKISRDEVREAGDLENITTELFLRARWLANLQSRITESPDWWKGLGYGARSLDDNLLKELYDQCIEAEVEWRKKIQEKAESTSASTTTA
jgi:hypothetical protein